MKDKTVPTSEVTSDLAIIVITLFADLNGLRDYIKETTPGFDHARLEELTKQRYQTLTEDFRKLDWPEDSPLLRVIERASKLTDE